MDQDVIQSLKALYKTMSIKKLIEAIKKKKPHPKSGALLDAENPFKELPEQLDKLAVYNHKFFPEETAANENVSVDDSLTRTEPLMTDDPILCDILDEEGSETAEDTDDVSNQPVCLQSSDVRQALDVLRECMLFSENREFTHKCLNEISVLVENEFSAKLRQANLRRFFQ